MKRITKTTATTPSCDAGAAPAAGRVLRFYIHSWEIDGGAPRPVVGQPLDGYRVVFRPSEPQDLYGLAAIEEDVDIDALPPQVIVPPQAQGGVRRGRLHAEWHVTPSDGPLYDAEALFGLVMRTRIISRDRQVGVWEDGEHMWLAIPGTLRLREVSGAEWDFDDRAQRTAPSPSALGDVMRGLEDAVLVDLQVQQPSPSDPASRGD